MKITKTIKNYAEKRGIELDVQEITMSYSEKLSSSERSEIKGIVGVLWFSTLDDDEPAFSYNIDENGSLIYRGNVWAPKSVIEELPSFINTTSKLKELINFLSTNEDFLNA